MKSEDSMTDLGILAGKTLVVDDEPDVFETVKARVSACDIFTAGDFQSVYDLIKHESSGRISVDIVGAHGNALFERTSTHMTSAAMLTAQTANGEGSDSDVARRQSAVSFLPQEELTRRTVLICELREELARGRRLLNASDPVPRNGSAGNSESAPLCSELVARPYNHFFNLIMADASWKKATNVLI
jgi:hypothetical protein